MYLVWILAIAAYLVIGSIIHAVIPDEDDELIGIIIVWPCFLVVIIVIGVFLAVKAFGYFIVNTFKQFFCKGEQDET
jgi:hypothetical protein